MAIISCAFEPFSGLAVLRWLVDTILQQRNMTNNNKYTIIGAGLSGLVTAYQLFKAGEKDFIILEARDRIGGRIYSSNGIDLGATWLQYFHRDLNNLLKELGLQKFEQFRKGTSTLVYDERAIPHNFEINTQEPAAHRVEGGTSALIEALAAPFQDKIFLNTQVQHISDNGQQVLVGSNNGQFSAKKVVVTLPPKLAKQLQYEPPLPDALYQAMSGTHTWMGNAIKVGIEFNSSFWKTQGHSGTLIGQVGPIKELYDHTNADNTRFALMGFVNENLRKLQPSDRKEYLFNGIENVLGKEVRNYTNYQEKDWAQDLYTSTATQESNYQHPNYGNPIFQALQMNGKLLFSGTETAANYGGYMEGAVSSGLQTARRLQQKEWNR